MRSVTLRSAALGAACLLIAGSAHATAILQGNTFLTGSQSKVADGVINWAVFDDYADISAMADDYATAGGGALSTTANYYYLYQFTNSGPNQLGITYISVDVPDLGLLHSVGWLAG